VNIDALLNRYVFETLGKPEDEREFKIKSLKKWGFDLVSGLVDGKEGLFLTDGSKNAGDSYTEDGVNYDVKEILKEIPKNQKIYAHISMIEGQPYLNIELDDEGIRKTLLTILAIPLLMAFLKKHKATHLIEQINNVGSATSLIIKNGESGTAKPFTEYPNKIRRFLRDAKKIEKEMGFGRIATAYFGENKDGLPRYFVEWLVPTIALFDESIANKIDKAIVELK